MELRQSGAAALALWAMAHLRQITGKISNIDFTRNTFKVFEGKINTREEHSAKLSVKGDKVRIERRNLSNELNSVVQIRWLQET